MASSSKWNAPDVKADDKIDKVQEYLESFEYLDRFGDPSENKKSISDALKKFQEVHGLEQTGTYDDKIKEKMSQPRCGFPDLNEGDQIGAFTPSGKTWNKEVLIWRIDKYSVDLQRNDFQDAIQKAFNEWEKYTAPKLKFKKWKDNDPRPDIIIKTVTGNHGDGYPFDGPGNVLAHAFFPPPTLGFLAGDVHFDEGEKWKEEFLQEVALHEIGHSLGLLHSNVRDAVMWPYFTPGKKTLHQDDQDGIKFLYP